MDFGKETIVLFEVDQPFCSLSYGNAPCAAALGVTGTRKCFNTNATCQNLANYSPSVPAIGAGGVAFDGLNDYLIRTTVMTGEAASKKLLVSFWIFMRNFPVGPKVIAEIGNVSDLTFYVSVGDQGYLLFLSRNTSTFQQVAQAVTPVPLVSNAWNHVLWAFDAAAGAAAQRLYVNDISALTTLDHTDVNVDWNANTKYGIGAESGAGGSTPGAAKITADIAEFYFAPGQYLDFDVEANRRKFRTADGLPVSLGATGSLPTGTAPLFLLHILNDEAPANFATNRAGNGNFTVNGALASSAISPQPDIPANQLTLRFGYPQEGLLKYGPVIPSMTGLDTTPATLNLGGMDKSASAMGTRESISVTFDDHLHSDDLVDKYRLERSTGVAQSVIDAYLSLPGVAGNFASTPDSVASSITGDIDLRCKMSMVDWTPGSATAVALIDKSDAVSGYRFIMNAANVLRLDVFVGGALRSPACTVGTGFVDGSTHWIRVTRASASGNTNFYTSEDGVAWTQLGAANVASTAGAISDNALTLQVGGRATLDTVNGRIVYADVRSVIAGSPVAKFDPNVAASGALSLTSTTGEVWTINTSGTPAAALVNPDGYDPYLRGTFWGKWITRNPYFANYICRVYEGFFGDAIADMRVRHYIVDSIQGPTDGQVTLTAKDLFSVIEAQKAVAPLASQGRLNADISAVAGSLTLTPAGIGNAEYPAAGDVNIGNECITFTRAADVLTLTVRGSLNTVAAAHKQEDLVQLVLSYTSQLVVDIVYDLLLNYSSMKSDNLPKLEWNFNAAALTTLYTGRITTPTAVMDLLAELEEQCGFTLWPDVSANKIRFAALRAAAPSVVVDDDGWFEDGSLTISRQANLRASQVWVYYAQINPTLNLTEKTNFRSRALSVDLTAEDDKQYGAPAIKEIFSRWIPQFGRGVALDAGSRSLSMFRDPPFQADFSLFVSREGSLNLAQFFALNTVDVQDDKGDPLNVTMAAVSIERGENDIKVAAQQVRFYAADTVSGDRIIYIENDSTDLNLRTIHDSLFAAPLGTETIRFIVIDGVTVGSTTTAAALRTGLWPAGVALFIEVDGKVTGRQGAGGVGGSSIWANPLTNGAAGQPGGLALLAEYPVTITGTGRIAGGGGGGGGGGAYRLVNSFQVGGGGGGSGAGIAAQPPGGGGAAANGNQNYPGGAGVQGAADSRGPGGPRGRTFSATAHSGSGGIGGNLGLPGTAGENADNSGGGAGSEASTGGAGGAAGDAIHGIAFCSVSGVTVVGATA